MGSVAIAGWIASVAFWALLAYGWAVDELHARSITIVLALWIAARFGLPYLGAGAFFTSTMAALDIALVFMIFKGDIPLT
jgi:hypothetical protein